MSKAIRTAGFVVTGLSIGWLVGLSASPVVSIALSTVLGCVAAALAALNGRPATSGGGAATPGLSPEGAVSIALLVVGIAVGSILGITGRTHNWLGRDVRSEIDFWEGLGIQRSAVVDRLFATAYPPTANQGTPSATTAGVLFAVANDECRRLLALTPDRLPVEMEASPNRIFNVLSTASSEPGRLRAAVEELCQGR